MASQSTSQTPSWLPYAGLLLAVSGMVYQGGVLSNTVAQNAQRIAKLEAITSVQADTINQINLRGASTQVKLDFLVEQAQKDHRR